MDTNSTITVYRIDEARYVWNLTFTPDGWTITEDDIYTLSGRNDEIPALINMLVYFARTDELPPPDNANSNTTQGFEIGSWYGDMTIGRNAMSNPISLTQEAAAHFAKALQEHLSTTT